MKIVPRGWQDFQHYKNRAPPWIKLHHKILDDHEFHRLPVASRALAPLLWLIASEHKEGIVNAEPETLAFRLRTSAGAISSALTPLIESGFFTVVQDDSIPLAECKQDAMPEKRESREREETDASRTPISGKSKTVIKPTSLPDSFCLSNRVLGWGAENGYTDEALSRHFENFILQAAAKGYTYANWDSALIKAISSDWAKVGRGISAERKLAQ